MATPTLKLKGALHLHTTLSHDGVMSLGELVAFIKGKGYDYMAITEHSYDIDNESMAELARQAEAYSTDDFLVIPGIEFRGHDYIDLLGYGVTVTCPSEDPSRIIEHINKHNGVAVLAHPAIRDYRIDPQWVAALDGCEMWNVTHEGKYVPQMKGIRKFRELAASNSNLLAFAGLDMHRPESYCYLSVTTFARSRSKTDILAALKAGAFRNESTLYSLGSDGKMSALKQAWVVLMGKLMAAARWIRNVMK